MALKILVVDDSAIDRELFRQLMIGEKQTWLRNVEFVFVSAAPRSLVDYVAYDGVVFDYDLGVGETGYEVAQRLHMVDPTLPLMLLTGKDPNALEEGALDYVHYVAWKGKPPQREGCFYYDIFHTLRAFVRLIEGGKR